MASFYITEYNLKSDLFIYFWAWNVQRFSADKSAVFPTETVCVYL